MNTSETLNWLAGLFEMPAGSITADTMREEIAAWDSLGVLTLIAGLDEQFNIQLKENEIQQMRSVKDVLNLLQSKGCIS
jgi:acyl carrier protein